MLFEKLFGRRRKVEHPANLTRPARPAKPNPDHPQPADRSASADGRPVPGAHQAEGFDPYNSGAFKKRNAWERVNRR